MQDAHKFIVILAVAFLIFLGIGQFSYKKTGSYEPPVMNKIDVSFVCRAAISAIFGRPIRIMMSRELSNGIWQIGYVRPSDGSTWNNACKISGNRVIWAGYERQQITRWRTDPRDAIVKFKLGSKNVTITQTYGDGSTSSDSVKRQ